MEVWGRKPLYEVTSPLTISYFSLVKRGAKIAKGKYIGIPMDVNFNKKERIGTEHLYSSVTFCITFKVVKDDHSLGWTQTDFLQVFQESKKNQASSYYTRKWLMQWKYNLRWLMKDPAMVLSKIKVSGTSDFNCTKDGVKIDSLHFYDQISLQMTCFTRPHLSLNCKTYIELLPVSCVFWLLLPSGYK